MTTVSTKEDADDVRQYIQDQLVEQSWVKDVKIDTDDRGWHVAVKVDGPAYKTSGHKIPSIVNKVSIVVFMIG